MALFQQGNIAFVDRRAHGQFALCDRSLVLRISPTRFPTAMAASAVAAVGRIANYLRCLVRSARETSSRDSRVSRSERISASFNSF
jgi:hypothetical protein